ncbi:phosphotransferase enzyme family protein [Blastomyces dermatitidis ER-3]|uniref:Phosphotransferase enzyme family protein n=1 Tax=Ajellomyces dermatitidis (strain ER-3 / ATCC MYA-2586) TaxID=559297 RepID=A0ABP2EZS9_AJEDR|nr:phosphotransferase enzyme family protein [Blastomyces dermatitidis ER-3]EEQ88985.1 phosphotransferase enzyme family protein [Blastomyces dermatitidis ER-3]
MDSSVRLPYYAADVPFPLPTEAEIENAPNISPEYGGRWVVQVGCHYVVKFGKGVNLVEGENMLFVREMTKVPVPRVYALYSNPQTCKNYIVMEHIAGDTLAKLWASLTCAEKESIVAKLRGYYKELRQLPSPGYYGSIGKRCFLDEIFWTRHEEVTINGLFTTEAALNEAMARKYTYDGWPCYRADFYRQCLSHIFCGHKPMFTHGDCQRKKIMIQSDPQRTTASNRALELVILDWEKSGWYPSYWEYCLAVCALHWDDDWGLWIEKMLDPFIAEVSWLQMLRLELWS